MSPTDDSNEPWLEKCSVFSCDEEFLGRDKESPGSDEELLELPIV